MPRKSATPKTPRAPLTRERILAEALRQADEAGVDALSMRKVAQALSVEAMSLYNHIANKDEMLNGIVELVMTEIYLPNTRGQWKTEMRKRGISVHAVLLRHPWAAPLMESRSSGTVQLSQHNAVLACLQTAGFPISIAHRAMLTVDSYLYGFAFQESTWPYQRADLPGVIQTMMPAVSVEKYPHLVELMRHMSQPIKGRREKSGGAVSDYASEFEFGLNLILNGLDQLSSK